MNKIKTIGLTGSAGYIGSVLKKLLIKEGYKIKVMDIKNIKCQDIIKYDNFKHNFKYVDIIIHLAGIVGFPNCVKDVNLTYSTNIDGTNNLIKYCKENKIPLIMASTCSIYGKKKNTVTEKATPNPLELYAMTKYLNEQKIKEELDNYIICRFGTVYGDSPSMRFDLVINGMSKRAFNERLVTIFGGNQRRPFISTEELSKTICKLIKEFEKGKQKQIYNLVAFNKSILDIGKEIAKLTKSKIEIKELDIDERDYEVSNEKIKHIYTPKDTMKKEIKKIWKKLERKEYK